MGLQLTLRFCIKVHSTKALINSHDDDASNNINTSTTNNYIHQITASRLLLTYLLGTEF